jgi:DNA-binding PadR family transcriptional regulator
MHEAGRMPRASLLLLAALLESSTEWRYGLELGKDVRLTSGTLYPALRRLEKDRIVESRWEDVDPSDEGRPRRRFYRLTGPGEAVADRARVEQIERLGGLPKPLTSPREAFQ